MKPLPTLAGLLLAALALDGLATWTLIAAPLPARVGALAWLLTVAGLGWLLWRALAASATLARGPRLGAWGLALLMLASLGASAWSYAPALLRLLGPAPRGLQMESLEGGRVLRLSGPLVPGDAARAEPLLAAAQRVEIDSSGGSPGDALALARQIAERPRTLLLRGPCTRDCALLFLASPQRLALPGAYLGLQRLPAPSLNPLWQRWLDARLAPAYAPLSELKRQRLRLTPPPALSLLEGLDLESVLSRPANPLLLMLPPAPASAGDQLLALQTHGVWPALEQRFPGSQAVLAEALAALPDDAARQQLAWTALRRQRAALLAEAAPALRLQLMELLAAQLQALSSDADCRALGAGAAGVHDRLPPALQAREAEWLRDAARDAQRDAPELKAIEREMLFIVLGGSRLRAIDRLRAGELGCAESRSLIDALLALPPAQRRLAAKRLTV